MGAFSHFQGIIDAKESEIAALKVELAECTKKANLWAGRCGEQHSQIGRLREALGDLMTWFPDEPSKPEWRLPGGDLGADDAVAAARSVLKEEY